MAKPSAEEIAEEKEIRAEVERKLKGMYNADGKPYAPWMMNTMDIEASVAAIRRRRARERAEAEASNTGDAIDPQGMESSGIGLKHRIIGENDVELGWVTGEEKDNVGFLIFRKLQGEPADAFVELASFKNFPPLNSKGVEGSFYSYIDENLEPGQYIYRVSDQDKKGRRTILCQTGVEVLSKGEKLKNTIIVALFAALVAGGVIGSFVYEPLQ